MKLVSASANWMAVFVITNSVRMKLNAGVNVKN